MKKTKRIYLDNAASTPVDRRVLHAMRPYWSDVFGNPGGIHKEGVTAAEAVMRARQDIADILQTTTDAIIFTGSGTEANNLALIGLAESLYAAGRSYRSMEIIISAIEHPSVIEPARHLQKRGVSVIEMDVQSDGRVDPKALAHHLSKKTILVSLGYVNSEIGTIAPLKEVAKIIREHRRRMGSSMPYFHTDACQAALYLPVNVSALGVDLMTLDAQKIHGPKGVGLLLKRRGITLKPLIHGGGQEGGLRSGTENVPGIVGFSRALALAENKKTERAEAVSRIRDRGIALLQSKIPGAFLNGSAAFRVPNNINITVPGLDGELMVLALDSVGIAASTKSACERESGPSHVLDALGIRGRSASSSLRLTLGSESTLLDIERVARTIAGLLERQRKIDKRLKK